MPQVYPLALGGGRNCDLGYRAFQFWLRDDPTWQANYARPEGSPEKTVAVKQLVDVQVKALTDYLLWHDRPPAPPTEPPAGK